MSYSDVKKASNVSAVLWKDFLTCVKLFLGVTGVFASLTGICVSVGIMAKGFKNTSADKPLLSFLK